MATKEVILREKIDGLGAEADVVKVKSGFANNFLVPQGKAYEATQENLKNLEDLQVARAAREAKELEDAQKLANKINKFKPVFKLELGQGGKAFGSVTSIDIQKKLEEAGHTVDRTAIQLDKPIKSSGETKVEIKLHTEVTAKLFIKVEALSEEA